MRRIEIAPRAAAAGARAPRAVGVRGCVGIALAIACGLACRAADAGSASASLTVTATVQSTCVASAASVAFPAYTAGGGPVTGSTTITVRCSPGLGFKVALSSGTTPGGNISQRLLSNGSQSLQYNLYTTSDLSNVWGDGTTGAMLAGVASSEGLATRLTVFGEVPDSASNRLATSGIYSDLVTITVTY